MSLAIGEDTSNQDGASETKDEPRDVDEPYQEEHRHSEIAELAKNLRRTTTNWSQIPDTPFNPLPDSTLDPHSSNFRSRDWIKSIVKLTAAEDSLPPRRAGIAFKDLHVFGYGTATDYQKDVGNVWLDAFGQVQHTLGLARSRKIDILHNLEGLLDSGEMLVVLGPPGAGCSSFLKTVTGETNGLHIEQKSSINYKGIPAREMHRYFRGEAIYTAENDVHFPFLTVGDTLYFAARARAPRSLPGDASKQQWATHLRDVIMAAFGISHTGHTRVGNDFVRGVSGGERKRVSIAEAILSGAPLQAWDNSTRGLDSANAIEFCKTVRLSTEFTGCAAAVALYQAPQAAFDTFDKALVLYEGRQIFYGSTGHAREYFERLGFVCPDRQTTADFLTSMTSSQERVIRQGFEGTAPRTADDFAAAWQASTERFQLLQEIDKFNEENVYYGENYDNFVASRKAQQARGQRLKSPFTLNYAQQVQLCIWRAWRRLIGDPSYIFTLLFGNFVLSLIIGSVFYNMQPSTDSFYSRGAVLFFAILLIAFGSALEILTLFSQRPIVEKHTRYAFYHPSAEGMASMLADVPYKTLNAIVSNLTLYFMVNLRRSPGSFFFFLLIVFFVNLTMSMLFRCMASLSRILPQALVPAAVVMLITVAFSGFVLPVDYMLGWCRWLNWLDPVAYAFESLVINEFHNRNFTCSQVVPPYGSLSENTQVCSAVGSQPGLDIVEGDAFMNSSYQYYASHKWRNFGIMLGFMVFFMVVGLAATEVITQKPSSGEVLVFRRGHGSARNDSRKDEESVQIGCGGAQTQQQPEKVDTSHTIEKQTSVFSWKDVCYDIKVAGGKERRILDQVDGWVKPGVLTALMGVSGAGKTTLLDALASRTTIGVVSGDMLVDGKPRDSSFQRRTGYVQQQDLHLQTSTVREALSFSALLRQPDYVSRKDKLDYVEEVIDLLGMREYAGAVVGVPGEGLNVEQRKRLTIGVELAARPGLLMFFDEPTSGLDSQTSWSILDFLVKLKESGQAILCTIHQPSAMLFQRFDRLLFLAKGGKTVYFGDIGQNSRVLVEYFERYGAPRCGDTTNPAEWMLQVIGAAPGSHTELDWVQTWRESPEYEQVQLELRRLAERQAETRIGDKHDDGEEQQQYWEFATPLTKQLYEVTIRVFLQYWRTPSYVYSKIALCLFSTLLIGLIYLNAPNTHQGLTNQSFSVFLLFTILGQLVQQMMPLFVTQRALYEARERPSKVYTWKAFIFSNLVVELAWNALMAVIMFVCFYYPIGLQNNAVPTDTHMVIVGVSDAETGGSLANLLVILSLIFCGVLARPSSLPGFWIFMYRVSPFTYLIGGMLGTGVANAATRCADNELLRFDPPVNQTCGEYMAPYIVGTNDQVGAGGYVMDPTSRSDCAYCTYGDTNVFLQSLSISYGDSWRDFGIVWAYIVFNAAAAVFLYWAARVPKKRKEKMQ
ncbi:hypothetical protein M409DRAFT_48938 [Zasmidium cellare ATCC 36951]|uniref:ABC transporter domain-containing protein n=1 Tax=Zasmidium cellare ATCC 36951 TaxID=1080233 RepID=A0A6A6D4J9_ZASCE|nr:uncharacterized protein M409DRAFT_48938 [Zasmidium cellare ATCC 36951]KAF2174053.1 hypothetical protein M409DRAFT_48938 [Zasmidium cellare ATCC 36951]